MQLVADRTIDKLTESREKRLDDDLVYKNNIDTPEGADPFVSEVVLWYGLLRHNVVAYTDPETFRKWHAHIVKGFKGLQYEDKMDAYYKVKEALEARKIVLPEELRQAA